MLALILATVLRFARAEPPPTDLIRAALAGDARAGQDLVAQAAPAIRARVLRHTRGRRGPGGLDTDDLTHEVWCRLLSDRGRRLLAYDPARGKTFGGYLSMITGQMISNLAETHGAQKRSAPGGLGALDEGVAVPEAKASPEVQVDARRALEGLWGALEQELPDRGRVVLRLLYVDGCGPAEAARRMGVKTQVVYNWQHKIRGLAKDWRQAAAESGKGEGAAPVAHGES